MMPRDQNTNAPHPSNATSTSTTPEEKSKDKELATLVVLVLLVASCHPCLSQQMAAQLHISANAVRNTMMFAGMMMVVASVVMFVEKGNAGKAARATGRKYA